jgi:hypothetical protein
MDPLTVISALLDIIIKIAGIEAAKAQLSLKEAELANQAADAIELARFGKTSGQ